MPGPSELTITCLCGGVQQTVTARDRGSGAELVLCHCDTCRHTTGQLCTSYYPIEAPAVPRGCTAFPSSARSTRYFCSTCGCHLLRANKAPGAVGAEWEVATGVITSSSSSSSATAGEIPPPPPAFVYTTHKHVSDTGDGGLAAWLPDLHMANGNADEDDAAPEPPDGDDEHPHPHPHQDPAPAAAAAEGEKQEPPQTLPASCQCGTVRFRLARPSAASRLLRAPYPDLIVPFHDAPDPDPDLRAANAATATNNNNNNNNNPNDEKWWLRAGPGPGPGPRPGDGGTRYLAGTCACRSCRLSAGFEVQAWAFVPRADIIDFHVPAPARASGAETASSTSTSTSSSSEKDTQFPLNFDKIPQSVLKTYESSTGTAWRDFCPVCGATVFWHDAARPDLVDVSVGLLRAPERGARAGRWLAWWTARVSFCEDARLGREGAFAAAAGLLVESLGRGLRGWGRPGASEL